MCRLQSDAHADKVIHYNSSQPATADFPSLSLLLLTLTPQHASITTYIQTLSCNHNSLQRNSKPQVLNTGALQYTVQPLDNCLGHYVTTCWTGLRVSLILPTVSVDDCLCAVSVAVAVNVISQGAGRVCLLKDLMRFPSPWSKLWHHLQHMLSAYRVEALNRDPADAQSGTTIYNDQWHNLNCLGPIISITRCN